MYCLASFHGQLAVIGFHNQGPSQDDREFVKLRALPGLSPASGAAHLSDAHPGLARAAPPAYSSISFGGNPAAVTRLGSRISSGTIASIWLE